MSGLKAAGDPGRRDARAGKGLEERRAPRRGGRAGTSVTRTRLRCNPPERARARFRRTALQDAYAAAATHANATATATAKIYHADMHKSPTQNASLDGVSASLDGVSASSRVATS